MNHYHVIHLAAWLGLLISGLVALVATTVTAIGFFTGYGLILFNLLALTFLSRLLVDAVKSQGSDHGRHVKWLGIGLGLIKFCVLMLGLYLVLGYFRLPAIAFASGALAALVAVTVGFATRYLKNMGHSGGM
jgi:hypothetical protein